MGPAKARRKTTKSTTIDSSSDDHIIPSEFEQNDEDLVEYLKSNTSFLLNMHATGAFTATQQNNSNMFCQLCFSFPSLKAILNSFADSFGTSQLGPIQTGQKISYSWNIVGSTPVLPWMVLSSQRERASVVLSLTVCASFAMPFLFESSLGDHILFCGCCLAAFPGMVLS